MSIAFGYTAVSEASWPQRPLASAMSLQPVPVCRGLALAVAWLWAMSKRALKKMNEDARQCESGARGAVVRYTGTAAVLS